MPRIRNNDSLTATGVHHRDMLKSRSVFAQAIMLLRIAGLVVFLFFKFKFLNWLERRRAATDD